MIYQRFENCLAMLANVEAIDYFLARQLADEYQQSANALLFHLLLALQLYTRQGHSCLPVETVANKRLFAETSSGEGTIVDAESAISKPGYAFPASEILRSTLTFLSANTGAEGPLVFEKDALYLRRYWQFECEVANALKRRLSFNPLQNDQLAWAQSIMAMLFPSPVKGRPANASKAADSANANWPKIAVANALGRNFSIITGGPGTGKTYTATRVLIALQATFGRYAPLKITMAAPTGKAAQRLNEAVLNEKPRLRQQGVAGALLDSIPENAMTLHRLLGFRPHSVQPKYGRARQLHCDVLLLDEVSMIDLPMLARLLRALPEQTRLIMLGDAEQLPSVEVGSILAELVGSQPICYQHQVAAQLAVLSGEPIINQAPQGNNDHVTRLIVSQRFGGEIKTLADQVINGRDDESWNTLTLGETVLREQSGEERDREEQGGKRPRTGFQSNSSINFESCFQHEQGGQLSLFNDSSQDFEAWLAAICQYYYQAVVWASCKEEAYAALKKFRIMTPTRVGSRGVNRLNQQLEAILSDADSGITAGGAYRGRPVMVTENNYGVGLFNGDIGLIWPDENTGRLMAWFEAETEIESNATDQLKKTNRYRGISLARLPAVETVYAMTIHKTQGSEFEHVAIVLPEQPSRLLSRQLLYTAITRAKSHVYVVGSKEIWAAAVRTRAERYSRLGARLAE